ncbi:MULTISPECIES: helix-turn-helix transcriptional regulator [Streptomyces]|uniref:Helix-turn-helix domain-containing protein n=1 Tax=Streptomyces odorifer TaxID=53450 RepID=A0A7Y6C9J6_9ACTN|nr:MULTISPECIES: helix-turn-helix transcriptional regulator [Streptomyces]NUV38298.1 helix-turn-helix domain-containing protein [Streptomyces sp. KAI-27]NUV49974.1 helix-turn-helix domain-containing protein [Streptomyces sp. CAI-78]MBL0802507.1 helix-turn-helix domain-containing protein [Streptomyces albidoflavus]MCK2141783.1 helix-turn-helix domain-containing protein [Streptomyces sp. WAC00276]MCR0986683.1 helix-turn-helix domain-containing protein [Streptomyces albidoflavus]
MSRRKAAPGALTAAATTADVFGEVLRYFREEAGLTQEALARQIPCDRSQIAHIEAGTRVPQDTFVKTCDEALGTRDALMRLWVRIDWYPQVEHPDWFKRRAEMDEVAVAVRQYQAQTIPGLLQTEEYAQALFAQVNGPEETEERVRARLSRQQRFLDPDGPMYIALLDESCLRTVVGDFDIMRRQYMYLLELARRPNIRIQVVPAGATGAIRPNTSMSIIRLPEGQEWVYSESLDRGHFSDAPAVLARHNQTYDVLRADALSASESASLIGEMTERYRPHGQVQPQRNPLDQEQLQRQQRRRLPRTRPRVPRPRPRPRQQDR